MDEIDEAAENLIAKSQREYVAFAKIVLSKIPENIKIQINEEFSTEEMEKYADCKTHWYGPTKQQLKRAVLEDLRYMLEDGWGACRVALASGEIALSLSLILRGHSDWKNGKMDHATGLLNKDGLTFARDPKPYGPNPIPASYFISKIAERSYLSPEAAKSVWEGIIEVLIGGEANLSKFNITIKYHFGETIDIQTDYPKD